MSANVAAPGELTRVLDELVRTRSAPGDDGHTVDISSFAIRPGAGRILEDLAAAIAPETLLEVGCASGLSTLYLCRGAQRTEARGGATGGATVHVIDPKQETHWKNIGRGVLARAGLESRVRFHEAPAHEVLPRLLAGGERLQLAFIDGWHMLDYVMVEAFYVDRMLDVGGVIALHDLWMPGLQHFASFWCANRPYEPVTVSDSGLRSEPVASESRECGDLAAASPFFRTRLAPYVDASVLLLRKVDEDRRRWDEFREFVTV